MVDAWGIKATLDDKSRLDGFRQALEALPENLRSYVALLETYGPGEASVPERVSAAKTHVAQTVTDGDLRQRLKTALGNCADAYGRTGNQPGAAAGPSQAWLEAFDRAVMLRALENQLAMLAGGATPRATVPFDALSERLRCSKLLTVQQVATHFSPETKEWITRLGFSISQPAAPKPFQLRLTASSRKIASGSTVVISWTSQNCTDLVLDGQKVSSSGSKTVTLADRQEFVLRALNPDKHPQEHRVIVEVVRPSRPVVPMPPVNPRETQPPPRPPQPREQKQQPREQHQQRQPDPLPRIEEFAISPTRLRPGDTLAVSWRVRHASAALILCDPLGISQRLLLTGESGGTTIRLPAKLPRGTFQISLRCGAQEVAREITVRAGKGRVVLLTTAALAAPLLIAATLILRLQTPTPVPLPLNAFWVGRWAGTLTSSSSNRTPVDLQMNIDGTASMTLGRSCQEQLRLRQQGTIELTYAVARTQGACGATLFQWPQLVIGLDRARGPGSFHVTWTGLGTQWQGSIARVVTSQPKPRRATVKPQKPVSAWQAIEDKCTASGDRESACHMLVQQCKENDVRPEFCIK